MMKKKIKNWIFRFAMKIIAKKIVHSTTHLTPQYLINRRWIEENGYYFELGIKDRDRIYISFENHYYRVWHSEEKTFIALENSVEWFELYYLLTRDKVRYKLERI